MLKVLLKKQMIEAFRGLFFDAKKNKLRSKGGIAAVCILFGFLMVGVLGGSFTFLAIGLSSGLAAAGMGWLYFAILSGIAIVFGTFGSIFSTYSGLYLPKDNDLLLSMPIPVRVIIFSRLLNVYLLGTLYTSLVMLPALIVWWVVVGANVLTVICGIILLLIVTMIVLILSCLLGWLVARVSLKLKNKSFVTVLISLLFIAGYYFIYFKAQDLIRDLIANAAVYGMNIKGSAYWIYLFGRVGEGDLAATGIFAGITAAILALVLYLVARSFLKLATTSAAFSGTVYKEKRVKQKSSFRALLRKEFSRFTSSPNYMLNCGLGVLLIPALGVFLLIKGGDILTAAAMLFPGKPDCAGLLMCAAMLILCTMNDMAAPSISMEGRSIWIPQTLPVTAGDVIIAKTVMQIFLTGIPMLFTSVCAAIVMQGSVIERLLVCILPLIFAVFSSLASTFLGLRHAIVNWTTEIVPIKQNAAVMIAIFGGWGLVALFALPYIFLAYPIGLTAYLSIWAVVFLALSIVLLRWIRTKGAQIFMSL